MLLKEEKFKLKIFLNLLTFLALILVLVFCFLFNLVFCGSKKTYSIELNNVKFEVAKPHDLKDVVILDAGHGYSDGGGGRDGVFEYIPNAQLIYKIANMLVDTGFFEVYITHPLNYAGRDLKFDVVKNPNHEFVHVILPEIKPDLGKKNLVGLKNYSKTYRASFVKEVMSSVVDSLKKSRSKIYSMSIHHNCAGDNVETNSNGSAVIPAGMRTFYCTNSSCEAYRENSMKFCNMVLKYCSKLYGVSTSDFLVRGNIFFVTQIHCPAILCEVDFIDNMQRQKLILDDRHQNRMARGIKNAIMEIYGYDVRWAKVSFKKIVVDDGFNLKFTVQNLPKNVEKLRFAAYGAVNDGKGNSLWKDANLDSDGNWNIEFKIPKNCSGKFFVDVYGEVDGKQVFIDSDFDEFELN